MKRKRPHAQPRLTVWFRLMRQDNAGRIIRQHDAQREDEIERLFTPYTDEIAATIRTHTIPRANTLSVFVVARPTGPLYHLPLPWE